MYADFWDRNLYDVTKPTNSSKAFKKKCRQNSCGPKNPRTNTTSVYIYYYCSIIFSIQSGDLKYAPNLLFRFKNV